MSKKKLNLSLDILENIIIMYLNDMRKYEKLENKISIKSSNKEIEEFCEESAITAAKGIKNLKNIKSTINTLREKSSKKELETALFALEEKILKVT